MLKFFRAISLALLLCFSLHSLFSSEQKASFRNKPSGIAVVAIFRDEAKFLKEWIEYYTLLGVSKFYLYNNLSKDHYLKVLKPYIKAGTVKLVNWKKESDSVGLWNRIQTRAYTNAMNLARAEGVKWLIVVDTDEFWVPKLHDNLPDLLKQYEGSNVGMISAFWIMFGTTNVYEIPKNKLMIETLLWNGGFSFLLGEKSILHTQRASTNGPHFGKCHPGFTAVKLPLCRAQINHYWSRDQRFFYENKVPRRILWGWTQEASENFVEKFNKQNEESAAPIQRFVAPLRGKMFSQ